MQTRRAIIIGAGQSLRAVDLDALDALGDTMALNYSYLPIEQIQPQWEPTYYCTMDPPDRFCQRWHQSQNVRSIIALAYERIARRNQYSNYTCIRMKRKDDGTNPFTSPDYALPYKTILAAVQYLVRANYQEVYFYGCDFVPNKKWYAMTDKDIDANSYEGKCVSNEDQLLALRRWRAYAAEMGCSWLSLSPHSRLNDFLPYQEISDGLQASL